MIQVIAVMCAFMLIDGALLWSNGIEYHDPIVTYNGKALWIYGAIGLVLSMLHVAIFG